jgi:hypothetical protein
MDDYDDEYYRAWMAVHFLYKDFLDGWFPSDEPGVMLRMSPPAKEIPCTSRGIGVEQLRSTNYCKKGRNS